MLCRATLLCLGLLIFFPGLAAGSNSILDTLRFDGSRGSVWSPDPAGLKVCDTALGHTICWDWPWVVDSKGNLSGIGTITVSGRVSGTLIGDISGRIRRKKGEKHSSVRLVMKLTGTLAGFNTRAKAHFAGKASPNGSRCAKQNLEGCFAGRLSMHACVLIRPNAKKKSRRKACFNGSERINTIIPITEGEWDLDLDVTDLDGINLAGTATANLGTTVLPNSFDYDAAGKFRKRNTKPRRKSVHLNLTPADMAGMGTWVKLSNVIVDQITGTIQRGDVSFKLLGQHGSKKIRP